MYNVRMKNTTMSIAFRKVTVGHAHCNDIPKVVDYLMEHYFPIAPLSKYMNLTECPEAVEFLRKFCVDALRENVSMIATNSDGEIAGVSCNMVIRKHHSFDFGNNSAIKKITDLIMHVTKECEIYEKYPDLDGYMYIAFLCVHEDYKENGITKRLIEHTRELALKLGLKLMRLDCCNSKTAKIAQKKGWTCLKEIEYAQYEVNDEQVFKPDEADDTFGVYVMNTAHQGFLKLPKSSQK